MRILKIAGYAGWFMAAFLMGIVVTFPMEGLKGTIVGFAEDALGKGKQGKHGTDPVVQIGSLTPSLASFGVTAKNVHIQLGSDNPEPGPSLDIEKATVGIRPWTLLSDAKSFVVDAKLYGGTVDGVVKVDVVKGALHAADVEIDELDLGKLTILMEKIGVPIAGKLSVDADLDLGETPEKDGSGTVKLDGKGLSIGPGTMKLGAMKIEVKLEQGPVDLGKLTGTIDVEQGKGILKDIKLASNDVNAELFGDVFVKSKIQNSRVDVDGFFQLMPTLLEREKSISSAIELGEKFGGMGGVSLPKARDDDGRYFFNLRGSASSPFPRLATDNGRKGKQRQAKGPSAPGPDPGEKPEKPEKPEKRERPTPPPRPALPPPAPPPPATDKPVEKPAEEKPAEPEAPPPKPEDGAPAPE